MESTKKIYPELDVQMYRTEDGDSKIVLQTHLRFKRGDKTYEMRFIEKGSCYSNEVFHHRVSACYCRLIINIEETRDKFIVDDFAIQNGLVSDVTEIVKKEQNGPNGQG